MHQASAMQSSHNCVKAPPCRGELLLHRRVRDSADVLERATSQEATGRPRPSPPPALAEAHESSTTSIMQREVDIRRDAVANFVVSLTIGLVLLSHDSSSHG